MQLFMLREWGVNHKNANTVVQYVHTYCRYVLVVKEGAFRTNNYKITDGAF